MAHAAARRFAMFTWMLPVVPDEQVLVNEGGQAPVYWYLKSKGHAPMAAAEERLEYLAGTFEIKSTPGKGTKITLTAPLLAAKAAAMKE